MFTVVSSQFQSFNYFTLIGSSHFPISELSVNKSSLSVEFFVVESSSGISFPLAKPAERYFPLIQWVALIENCITAPMRDIRCWDIIWTWKILLATLKLGTNCINHQICQQNTELREGHTTYLRFGRWNSKSVCLASLIRVAISYYVICSLANNACELNVEGELFSSKEENSKRRTLDSDQIR